MQSGPPGHPIRTPAEFESVERVVIQWDPGEADALHVGLVAGILRARAEPVVLVDSAEAQQRIIEILDKTALPWKDVRFLLVTTDSIWARDYAGRTVFSGTPPQRLLVDWNYDFPGALYDDFAPQFFGPALGLAVRTDTMEAPVFFSWGDLIVDGFGNGFSSKKVLEHNRGDTEYLASSLAAYLGLERHTVLDRLESGPDNHIDMYMKLLDEETIMVAQYKEMNESTSVLEANAAYLSTLMSCYGRAYRVVRIAMPGSPTTDDFRTYTNSLIVNNVVLLPVYQLPEDDDAIEVYRENMPAYEIFPIDARGVTQQRGAIRCVTSEIAQTGRIRIGHPRFLLPMRQGDTLRFTATVWPPSENYQLGLHIRNEGTAEFTRIAMQPLNGEYVADLAFQEAGSTAYYIHARGPGMEGYKPQNAAFGGTLRLDISADSRAQ